MKVGEYEYRPHGRDFRIYRCDYSDGRITIADALLIARIAIGVA